MTDEESVRFKTTSLILLPEVGSRAMHRLTVVGDELFEAGWLTVQEDRYRYRTSQNNGLAVRMVLREHLACSVVWS
jgi:hypothetical protein